MRILALVNKVVYYSPVPPGLRLAVINHEKSLTQHIIMMERTQISVMTIIRPLKIEISKIIKAVNL